MHGDLEELNSETRLLLPSGTPFETETRRALTIASRPKGRALRVQGGLEGGEGVTNMSAYFKILLCYPGGGLGLMRAATSRSPGAIARAAGFATA